jgi:hypothetical protein
VGETAVEVGLGASGAAPAGAVAGNASSAISQLTAQSRRRRCTGPG